MPLTTDYGEIAGARNRPFAGEIARIRAVYERRKRDVHPDRYSDANPRAAVFQREIERRILELLARKNAANLAEKRVLEVGCGEGRWLRRFVQRGASPENLAGIDLLPDSIAAARRACHPSMHLFCGNANQLPFADRSLDIVLCMTVFTSILDPELRVAVAAEMVRVLRPGGFVLWFDFFVNNPANPDVRRVGKTEIARLFPGCEIELARITVAAPLGRVIAQIPYAYSLVAKSRILCTHYLGWFCKR